MTDSRDSNAPAPEALDYLPGPEPILTSPPLREAMAAQNALEQVLARNAKRGALVSGITPIQADTLLAWIAYRTRMCLLPPEIAADPKAAAAEYAKPDMLDEACGDGQAFVNFQAEMLGLKSYRHEVSRFIKGDRYGHSFSVVILPVQTPDGLVEPRPYLIDTTLRQFFHPPPATSLQNAWGLALSSTPKGRMLADGILRHGYARLTPDTAQQYIGSADFDTSLDAPVQTQYPDLLGALTHGHTESLLYSPQAILVRDHDLRTPRMVRQQRPLSDMLASHEKGSAIGEQPWWDTAIAASVKRTAHEHERFLQASAATVIPETPEQAAREDQQRADFQRRYHSGPGDDAPSLAQWNANKQLLDAVYDGNHSRLLNAFNKHAYVNVHDGHGNTALHIAAKGGKLDIILALLEAGADVNAPNWAGQTPLHVVKNELAAKALLAAGADPYLLDQSDQSIVTTRYPFVPTQNREVERTPVLTAYLTRIFNREEAIPTVQELNDRIRSKGLQYHPQRREKALAKLIEQARDAYPFGSPYQTVRAAEHQGYAKPSEQLEKK